MMNDRFSVELRQHLLLTANDRPAVGQLAAVVAAVSATPQSRPLAARLRWNPERTGPFPAVALRYGLLVLALAVASLVAALFIAGGSWRSTEFPTPVPVSPLPSPQVELGIFAPVAGRILSGLWAVDPVAVDPSTPSNLTQLRLGPPSVLALGWSRDGTELLFMRKDPTDSEGRYLYILHADGTETQVTPERVGGAAISPDGSRVVFAGDRDDGLYVVDSGGGQPVRIADGEEPTFSPDGTQIAYLSLPRSGCCVEGGREHVWVANADGTEAHEILADEPALADGVFHLEWSPAGDRIAMANGGESEVAIYTFAPDGSHLMKVFIGGFNPHWSPDGSQIAFGWPGLDGVSIADADGSNMRTFDVGAPGPWHPGSQALPTRAPAPESTSSPTSDSREEGCIRFDRPSSYTADAGALTLTVDVPATAESIWHGLRERFYLVNAPCLFGGDRLEASIVNVVYPDGCYRAGAGVEVDSPADAIAAVAALEGVEAAGRIDVTLGGYSGSRFDITVPPNYVATACNDGAVVVFDGITNLDAGTMQLYVVDVEGTTLAIAIFGNEGGDPAVAAEIDGILASIQIER